MISQRLSLRLPLRGIALLAAVVAAGCSSGVSGITTSALSGVPKAAPTPPEVKPTDRALIAAAVSARAQKCGYNFDPARLRAMYVESEIGKGLAPPEVSTIERLYDVTRASVAGRIRDDQDYCGADKTREIKADLQRHLAGDFSVKPKPGEEGVFAGLQSQRGPEKLNPEWMRNQQWEPRTKSASGGE